MDRIAADFVLRVLHGHGFGHQPDCGLRGVVRHVDLLAADDAGDRRKIDDRAAAIRDHRGDRVFDAVEHAGRVDGHDAMPGFGAVTILLRAAGYAGVVDEYVE